MADIAVDCEFFDMLVATSDYWHGGAGVISGAVKKDDTPTDVPLRRQVRALREVDSRFVREVWSDAVTGEYLIPDVDPAYKYTLLAFDHTGEFEAVVATGVTPTVP